MINEEITIKNQKIFELVGKISILNNEIRGISGEIENELKSLFQNSRILYGGEVKNTDGFEIKYVQLEYENNIPVDGGTVTAKIEPLKG